MTQTLTMRLDSEDKIAFENFCSSVGLTASGALNIFVKATLREGQIPFAIKADNYGPKIHKAMEEADDIQSGKIEAKLYPDADSLFAELDKE